MGFTTFLPLGIELRVPCHMSIHLHIAFCFSPLTMKARKKHLYKQLNLFFFFGLKTKFISHSFRGQEVRDQGAGQFGSWWALFLARCVLTWQGEEL